MGVQGDGCAQARACMQQRAAATLAHFSLLGARFPLFRCNGVPASSLQGRGRCIHCLSAAGPHLQAHGQAPGSPGGAPSLPRLGPAQRMPNPDGGCAGQPSHRHVRQACVRSAVQWGWAGREAGAGFTPSGSQSAGTAATGAHAQQRRAGLARGPCALPAARALHLTCLSRGPSWIRRRRARAAGRSSAP